MSATPHFSIVIPAYNRADLLPRAVRSCLDQDHDAFEVIIVDDASTDGTADVAAAFGDARVRVLRHETNRGQCPGRNTGARSARGEWIVFLDSDDELVPGALRRLDPYTRAAGDRYAKLYAMATYGGGSVTPDPPLDGSVWDYEAYVRWIEAMVDRPSEALPCARRSEFLTEPYPESHAHEAVHNLNFSERYRMLACPEVVRRYHQDASDRIILPDTQRLLRYAPEYLAEVDEILERHGRALERWAPTVHRQYLRSAALYSFLLGRRLSGLRWTAASLRRAPASPKAWAVALLGLIGPRPLSWFRSRAALRNTQRLRSA